jgi:hypothetical protein
MGKKQHAIGKGFEYRVVHKAQSYMLPAKRIVLSGSTDEKLDVEIAGMRFECKYRSSGLKSIFTWLEKTERDGGMGVIVGGGRNNPVVVMRLERFFQLIGGMKKHESSKG